MIQSVSGGLGNLAAMSMASRPQPPDPQELFGSADADGSESLDLAELQELLAGAPDGAPDAEQMLADLDSDGDGALSFAEFEAGRPQGPPPQGPPPGAGGSDLDLSRLFAGGEDTDTATSILSAYLA